MERKQDEFLTCVRRVSWKLSNYTPQQMYGKGKRMGTGGNRRRTDGEKQSNERRLGESRVEYVAQYKGEERDFTYKNMHRDNRCRSRMRERKERAEEGLYQSHLQQRL